MARSQIGQGKSRGFGLVHKTTGNEFWLDSKWIPPWVTAAKGPGFLGSSFSSEQFGGEREDIAKLWEEFFSDPTKWRDHRLDNANPRVPDFRHKKQQRKALFLISEWIPPWVKDKLAALPPGTIELSTLSWNQRLSRCAQARQYEKTMEVFQQMQREGKVASKSTFSQVLKACANLGLLEHGRRIHQMMQRKFVADLFIGSALVNMYAKCGSIKEAEGVFNNMTARNVVSWNAMISGYVKCGEGLKALELFEQMRQQGVDPNHVTFLGVLNASASVEALQGVRRVHAEIIRRHYDSNIVVGNCLIDTYVKCGSIEEAELVFNKMPARDVVGWTAMIGGYVKCGDGQKALELFKQMQGQGLDPNHVTFIGVLNACASVAALEGGRRAHEEIVHRGYQLDVVVGNSLIDMYAKCGSIKEAERVFNDMPRRDVVAWNSMLGGYVNCGEGLKALELFEQMQRQGVDPDQVTFVGVLNSCASVAAVERGRCAHKQIIQSGYELDDVVGNCLIDMYAKCGSIEEAEIVFNKMPTRDVVGWNALMHGYGRHGYCRRVLETFKRMCENSEVNGITYLSLLSTCGHGGLVDEGLEYFKSMNAVHGISPTVDHFACVVDLLGRAGRLIEAEDLIISMPMDPDATLWTSLLSACRAHVNVKVGERCAKRVLELEPENSAGYVLLSDIYVAAGKWGSRAQVLQERLNRVVRTTPGCRLLPTNMF